MSLQAYPEGIDCVWLASDREGYLAAFVTAGIGPIPLMALDSMYMPVEDVEGRLCLLPPVSKAEILVSVKRPDDFIDLAERGFFVYDWTDINREARDERRVYEPVAVPTAPIGIGSLPPDLAALASALRFDGLSFSDGKHVDVREYFSCAAMK